MGDQINNLSIPLYRILDKVGASESNRKLHQQTATNCEILDSIEETYKNGRKCNGYVCGSSFEGSVTPDLTADVDVVECYIYLPVKLCIAELAHEFSLLMVQDSWTPPGYCKLQHVENGEFMYDKRLIQTFDIDYKGRTCKKHIEGRNMKGPADMSVDEKGVHFADTVRALRCDTIPPSDLQWIMRPRPYHWPSPEQLQTMSRQGCMFVGVGKSSEDELEWRMSYTLQERLLMTSLNPTQHKVYILLKLIKKDIFRDMLHEESLSSYHFKTCILYAVQMTPAHAWTPCNLVKCLLLCLKLMERWLKSGYCPSFLVKDQNLFSKVDFVTVRHRMLEVMEYIIRGGSQFLYMLCSDNIGALLRDYKLMEAGVRNKLMEAGVRKKNKFMFDLKERQIRYTAFASFNLIKSLSDDSYDPLYLSNKLERLKNEVQTSDHTIEETNTALEQLYPWLDLHIANGFASASVTFANVFVKAMFKRIAYDHHIDARGVDLVNSRLAMATVMYAYGNNEVCFEQLQLLENEFAHHIMLYCPCTESNLNTFYDDDATIEGERYRKLANLSVRHITESHTACCVIFLPSAAAIVPEPLKYEMQRSEGTPKGSRNETKDFWFDWVAVDARSYLYFLQYLVSTKLQNHEYRNMSRNKLKLEIFKDDWFMTSTGQKDYLGHKETACNLLGWIYVQEGKFDDAFAYFKKSLKIRPLHNAAKRHMREWLSMTSERRDS